MKLTILLFLICLMDVVYSYKMKTLRNSKKRRGNFNIATNIQINHGTNCVMPNFGRCFNEYREPSFENNYGYENEEENNEMYGNGNEGIPYNNQEYDDQDENWETPQLNSNVKAHSNNVIMVNGVDLSKSCDPNKSCTINMVSRVSPFLNYVQKRVQVSLQNKCMEKLRNKYVKCLTRNKR